MVINRVDTNRITFPRQQSNAAPRQQSNAPYPWQGNVTPRQRGNAPPRQVIPKDIRSGRRPHRSHRFRFRYRNRCPAPDRRSLRP